MSTASSAWVVVGSALKRRGRTDKTLGSQAVIPELPWTMPSRSTMHAAGKDVLAYFHTLPLYWRDGNNLYAGNISPTGNSSANLNSGGRWRQRPYPIVDNTNLTDDIRIQWMTYDIQNAANIGIDAFRVEILTEVAITQDWRWTEHVSKLWTAAENFNAAYTPGFRVCPDMDGSSISANNGDPVAWANFIAPLLKSTAAYTWRDPTTKTDTGRPVVFCYQFNSVPGGTSWWTSFVNQLIAQGVSNPAVIPAYQGSNPSTDVQPYLSFFTSGRFVALHNWATSNYTSTPSQIQSTVRSWCSTNSIPFCGSVGPAWENDRPANVPQPKETEGYGLQTLQNEWQASILNNDPLVSIISWGDHEESHNIRPSTGYQYVPYDVCSYYLAQYKTGTAPTITRDALYYCHRMHKGSDPYDTTKQTVGAYTVAYGPTPDLVIAHVWLMGTSDVTITTGGTAHTTTGIAAPVGIATAPMVDNDTPSFKVTRSGVDVVPQFSSAFPTRSPITYQDLCYRMGSSTRAVIDNVQNNLPQDR